MNNREKRNLEKMEDVRRQAQIVKQIALVHSKVNALIALIGQTGLIDMDALQKSMNEFYKEDVRLIDEQVSKVTDSYNKANQDGLSTLKEYMKSKETNNGSKE